MFFEPQVTTLYVFHGCPSESYLSELEYNCVGDASERFEILQKKTLGQYSSLRNLSRESWRRSLDKT